MKKFLVCATVIALISVSTTASAEEKYSPVRVGFGMDLGVPSGASLGIVVCEDACGLRGQVSLTHNALAFGGRASIKLDPFALMPKIPIGFFFDWQGGFTGQGSIPGHADLPTVGYDYLNFYGGLRLGKAKNFHWNFEVGPTYLVANTSNFQSYVNKNGTGNVSVSDPDPSSSILITSSSILSKRRMMVLKSLAFCASGNLLLSNQHESD